MRIAYIVKEFPRLSETFILTELLELERLGHELVVFSRHAPAEDVPHAALARLKAPVIQLQPFLREQLWEAFAAHLEHSRTLGARYDQALESAIELKSRNEMRYWIVAGALANELERRGVDLVHAHFATGSASLARYASELSGVPFTFTAHAKDIYARSVNDARLADLCRSARAVVTVSDYNKSYLEDLAEEACVERVYNGVDLERFRLRAVAGRGGDPLLLFVGRFVEKKGLSVLLDALPRLDTANVRVRLVGSGPLEEALRAQARALGIADRVEFAGPASQEEVYQHHFADASAFVMPAVIAEDGDRDGLPTTLLEASASGVPAIGTAVTGIPEILGGGETGLIAEPGDVDSLARVIDETLSDAHATSARVSAGRKRCETLFNAQLNVGRLERVFEDAVKDMRRAESA